MTVSRIAHRMIARYGAAFAFEKARHRVTHHLTRTRDDGWMYVWMRVSWHIERIGYAQEWQ
jgi:hypothetical protein